MADPVEGSFGEEPSALVTLVLAQKAIGLSNLEVAAKLMIAESTVRSIVHKHARVLSTASRLRHESEASGRAHTSSFSA